jgi:galactokinase
MQAEELERSFHRAFGAPPAGVARAPGRVNLIGEHTDYNQGFVLPMAIEPAVRIAFRPRADRRVLVRSLDFHEQVEIDLRDLSAARAGWRAYLAGVAWALQGAGRPLIGWEGVIQSQVPVGSGMSSSAALQIAVARVFASVSGLAWDPAEMARRVQHAENEWVGVRCGIMDMLASACGERGHALLIDCLDLSRDQVRMPGTAEVVVLDSSTRRELSQSGYNDRRSECESAARILHVPSLRFVGVAELEAQRELLTPPLYQRARHVVTENRRTLEAAAWLQSGEVVNFGRAMTASHASLRDDFQISTPQMDTLAELAQRHPACYGARMMGGGFGGSVVCLAEQAGSRELARDVLRAYRKATGLQGTAAITRAEAGASLSS